MDPNECYKRWTRALLLEDAADAIEAWIALRTWLANGGFEPSAFDNILAKKQFMGQFDFLTGRLK